MDLDLAGPFRSQGPPPPSNPASTDDATVNSDCCNCILTSNWGDLSDAMKGKYGKVLLLGSVSTAHMQSGMVAVKFKCSNLG